MRKIYHKTGFITDADVIGDYTLIHTFADDTAYADTVAAFDGFEDGATYGVPPFTLAANVGGGNSSTRVHGLAKRDVWQRSRGGLFHAKAERQCNGLHGDSQGIG